MNFFFIIFAGVLILLFSLISAMGSIKFALAGLSLTLGSVLVLNPYLHLLITLLVSLVVAGLLETFLQFGQGNWISSGISLVLILTVLFSKSQLPKETKKSRESSWSRVLMFFGIVSYAISILISILVNLPPAIQVIVGLKNYVPYIGVFLVLHFARIKPQQLQNIFHFVIWIGALQWVFCIAEYLSGFQATATNGIAETMLGSFGGNPITGGYTGEMAVFVTMNLFLCTMLWQAKLLKTSVWLLALFSALFSIGLAETKIVFILIPIMTIITLWKYPGGLSIKVIKLLILAAFAFSLIAIIYSQKYWTDSKEFTHAFTYSFDPDFMIDKHHRGRIASIIHWWQQMTMHGDILHALTGFGPAASQEVSSIAGAGSAVLLYGLGLDNNAMTRLLWDFGLFGFIGFLLILIGAFCEAIKISRKPQSSIWVTWLMVALKSWVIAFIIMLPYQVSMVGAVPVQFLFWLTIGSIAYYGNPKLKNDRNV